MSILESLTSAVGAVRRNPVILVVSIAFALLQTPSLAANQFSPAVASALSLFTSAVSLLVTPFVFAGAIVLAAEALDGDTGLNSFVSAGKTHYLRVLGAYVLLVVVVIVISLVGIFVAGATAVIVNTGVSNVFLSGTLGVLVGVVLVLLPTFFLQFFAHAIVLDGQGITDGFRRSAGVVRRNLLTVAGYTAVIVVLSSVGGAVGAVASIAGAPQATSLGVQTLSTPVLVGLQLLATLFTGLFAAVFWPFSVAVYRSIRDRTVADAHNEQPAPA